MKISILIIHSAVQAKEKPERLLLGADITQSPNENQITQSPNENQPPQKIAFGSCFKQYGTGAQQTEIFERIIESKPEMFLWTGDAAYQEQRGFENLKKAFKQTKENPVYQRLIAEIPVDGIWDDHDLGPNDSDGATPRIQERRKEFLKFLDVPTSDPRWDPNMEGLYFSKEFGPAGAKVKFLILDTRTLRKTYYSHDRSDCFEDLWCVDEENMARWSNYQCDQSSNDDAPLNLLGQEQHEWFKRELQESDADVHIVVSGIQFFSKDLDMENWMHWHADRRRLFRTLQETDPKGLIFLSGDVHRAEYFKLGNTFMEMTSSGINRGNMSENTSDMFSWVVESYCGIEGQNYCYNNFGMLEFDWVNREVTVSARGEDGQTKLSWVRNMDERVAGQLSQYQPEECW